MAVSADQGVILYKNVTIWVVVCVLGWIPAQNQIGNANAEDRLLSGGAIVLHPSLRRPSWKPRFTVAPALRADSVFADVELEMQNMQERLIAELQGVERDIEPLVKPISIE